MKQESREEQPQNTSLTKSNILWFNVLPCRPACMLLLLLLNFSTLCFTAVPTWLFCFHNTGGKCQSTNFCWGSKPHKSSRAADPWLGIRTQQPVHTQKHHRHINNQLSSEFNHCWYLISWFTSTTSLSGASSGDLVPEYNEYLHLFSEIYNCWLHQHDVCDSLMVNSACAGSHWRCRVKCLLDSCWMNYI